MDDFPQSIVERFFVTVLDHPPRSLDLGREHLGQPDLQGEVDLWEVNRLAEEVIELGSFAVFEVFCGLRAQVPEGFSDLGLGRQTLGGIAAALGFLLTPARTRFAAPALCHGYHLDFALPDPF